MKMKEVITKTGIPEKTIRYYESRGLVKPATERRNGRTYHEFSAEDVGALRSIVVLRKAQFSIEEILTMQTSPEKISEISAALRQRVQEASEMMTRLLSAEDVFSARDWMTLSGRVEKALGTQNSGIMPFRFGAEDPETPEEKAAAIAAYQKRHSRRWWIPVMVVLSLLCLALGGGLGYLLHKEASAVPETAGSTAGWIYYISGSDLGKSLYRCREDGSENQKLYDSAIGGFLSNVVVSEEKVYFLDGQQLYSINADGSGVYKFKTRYYSGYSNESWVPTLAGTYLYAKEFSSGQLGGSSSCIVKISTEDGKAEELKLPEDMSVSFMGEKDGVLYLVGKTVEEYGDEASDIVYYYELIAYDPENHRVLSRRQLEDWDGYGDTLVSHENLYFVREDGNTEQVILLLDHENLQFVEYAVIPGDVKSIWGKYCCYRGDFWGNELGGSYEGWYVMNMETGETVGYSNEDMDFAGFGEEGFLCTDSGGETLLVPYP